MNVLIISSSEGITLSLLRCLGLMGINSHVVSVWYSSKSSKLSRFCKKYISCMLSELSDKSEKVVEIVNDYCKKEQIEVIIPSGLLGTFFIANRTYATGTGDR